MENKTNNNEINFIITSEQVEVICRHFGKERKDLEDYEVCELLDKLIDNLD
jgi:hypothetical protein